MTDLLIVCDNRKWAFDSIAGSLKKELAKDDIRVDISYVKSKDDIKAACRRHENVLWMGWSLAIRKALPLHKKYFSKNVNFRDYVLRPKTFSRRPEDMLIGVHAHHDWDDRGTSPENDVAPPDNLIEVLRKFKRVNVVSTRLYKIFKDSGLDNVSCTLNGVDEDMFYPDKKLSGTKKLRVGYAGTRKRDWKENITSLIDPLSKLDFVDLRLATPQDNYVPHSAMPRFYNDIDVYICASFSEGFSLSVLEASACGRPVVSTMVGGSRDLITDGHNGLFVKMDLEDIKEKLYYLHRNRDKLIEMGQNNRAEVEKKWSWKIRSRDWARFIRGDIKDAG